MWPQSVFGNISVYKARARVCLVIFAVRYLMISNQDIVLKMESVSITSNVWVPQQIGGVDVSQQIGIGVGASEQKG